MAIEAQTVSSPKIEQSIQESSQPSSWQELTTKTFAKGSEKLAQLSAHITRRTWDFFDETTYNSIVGIPAIVKTALTHGFITAPFLIAETVYAPPEQLHLWYGTTLCVAGVSLGLSILKKILPESYD